MAGFETRMEGAKLTLAVSGELTIEHAGELRDALLEAMAGGQELTVDLGGVNEMDLACAQTLMAASRSLSARNAVLVITGLTGRARNAAECGGLVLEEPAAVAGVITGGIHEQEDNDG